MVIEKIKYWPWWRINIVFIFCFCVVVLTRSVTSCGKIEVFILLDGILEGTFFSFFLPPPPAKTITKISNNSALLVFFVSKNNNTDNKVQTYACVFFLLFFMTKWFNWLAVKISQKHGNMFNLTVRTVKEHKMQNKKKFSVCLSLQ